MDQIPGFVLAGFALTGSPGPATLGLAAAGAAFGLRKSLPLAIGTIIGVLAVLVIAASGLAALALAHPILGPAARIASALYMAWLAWKIATAPPLEESDDARKAPSFFFGMFLGLGNPKAYAAMVALASGFVLVTDQPLADFALKAAILLVMLVIVDLAWLLLGSGLTRIFRDPTLNRIVNVSFAVLLIASVAFAFAQ